MMGIEDIIGLSIIGALWLAGVCAFIFAWIKTKTLPFELPDDELFDRAFGKEKDE